PPGTRGTAGDQRSDRGCRRGLRRRYENLPAPRDARALSPAPGGRPEPGGVLRRHGTAPRAVRHGLLKRRATHLDGMMRGVDPSRRDTLPDPAVLAAFGLAAAPLRAAESGLIN